MMLLMCWFSWLVGLLFYWVDRFGLVLDWFGSHGGLVGFLVIGLFVCLVELVCFGFGLVHMMAYLVLWFVCVFACFELVCVLVCFVNFVVYLVCWRAGVFGLVWCCLVWLISWFSWFVGLLFAGLFGLVVFGVVHVLVLLV